MKMVDKKAGQKLNIVDRKFRMTPKRQRMILKKLRMTPRMWIWHQNDTKNGTLTDDLQEFNNDAMNTHDTKNDTNNWWMKLYVLEVNFLNDSMEFNKRLLSKRKIRWYTIAMKVLLLSSFKKQKSMFWHFSETHT